MTGRSTKAPPGQNSSLALKNGSPDDYRQTGGRPNIVLQHSHEICVLQDISELPAQYRDTFGIVIDALSGNKLGEQSDESTG